MHKLIKKGMTIFLVTLLVIGGQLGLIAPESASAAGNFAGGIGTASDPYQIATASQLNDVRTYHSVDTYFKLTKDIDLSSYSTGAGWLPIGNDASLYRAHINGNGFKITNLTINRPTTTNVGLFGKTASGSTVTNMILENVAVTGQTNVGGLVGHNSGTISNSYTTGSVTGTSVVGGLVGHHNYGAISNSYSLASVSGTSYLGGVAGQNYHASLTTTLSNSYAAGTISVSATNSGGLIGYNGETVTSSYYDKTTSGRSDTGKGEGKTTAEMQNSATYVGWNFGIDWYVVSGQYPKLWALTLLTQGTDSGTTKLMNVAAGMEYSLDGTNYTAITGSSVDNIMVNVGNSIYVRVIAMPSSAKTLLVGVADMKLAAAPTTAVLEAGTAGGTTKLANVTSGMEYKVNSGSYTAITGTSVDDISVNAGDTISVRYTAPLSTDQDLVVGLSDIQSGAAPTTPALVNGSDPRTTRLIHVTSVMEYKVNSGNYLETLGTTVDNINAIVGDSISVRMKATALQPASMDLIMVVGSSDLAPGEIGAAAAYFAGGMGTVNEPYQIAAADQLNALRTHHTTGTYFELTANIDLSSYSSGSGWLPIGDDASLYRANINGNGFKITNLTINRPTTTNVGLFGKTASGSTITNMILENVGVTGQTNVGGLVGHNSGTISNSYTTGSVTGTSVVGGLVGHHNYGEISNSYSLASISGTSYLGGLAGQNYHASLTTNLSNSYVAGTISVSATNSGGLIGYNGETVTSSYYDKTTSGRSDAGKGEGKTTAEMQNSATYVGWNFNTDWYVVSGQYPQLWALTLLTQGTDSGTTKLMNVAAGMEYSLDGTNYTAITGSSVDNIIVNVGDTIDVRVVAAPTSAKTLLVGLADITLAAAPTSAVLEAGTAGGTTKLVNVTSGMEYKVNSGSYTAITGTSVDDISVNAGDIISVRYTAPLSTDQDLVVGLSDIQSGAAPTTPALVNGSDPRTTRLIHVTSVMEYKVNSGNYLETLGTTVDNINAIVGDSISVRMKATALQPASMDLIMVVGSSDLAPGEIGAAAAYFAGGMGTVNEPYQIAAADQLNALRTHHTTGTYFELTKDIDLSSYSTGDGWLPIGNDTSLYRAHLNGNGFKITNLTINRPTTTNVGLFGKTASGSTITNMILEDVAVTGQTNVGGLAGHNSGSISDSYTTGSVTGTSSVGGLVGHHNYGAVSNSYSLASVSGTSYLGGLAGQNYSDSGTSIITNSYATGGVSGTGHSHGGVVGYNNGTINNSFYDKDTTTQIDTGKGEGKTTAEMQNSATYTGWNFNTDWFMLSGHYPRLWALTLLTQGTDSGTTKLMNVAAGMEYSLDGTNYTAITGSSVDNISVNVGDTIDVRVVVAPTSARTLLVGLADITLAAAPTSAVLEAGTAGGTTRLVNVTSGMEYKVNSGSYTAITGTSVDDISVNAGDIISVRYTAPLSTDQDLVVGLSDIQSGVAPTTPALAIGSDPRTTRLINVTSIMEYKVNSGSYLEIAGTSVDNINVIIGDSISVRLKATSLQPASNDLIRVVGFSDIRPGLSVDTTLNSSIGIVSLVDNSITNIPNGTSLLALKAAITIALNATFEVYEADGTTVATQLVSGNKLIVTAQDEVTQVTYTLTVNDADIGPEQSGNANLIGLTLSSGALSPEFDSESMFYVSSVANSVYNLTVTASIYDINATMTVNGITLASGQISEPITLNVGSNTITIVVTAQNLTLKSYIITVTRAHTQIIINNNDDNDVPAVPTNVTITSTTGDITLPAGRTGEVRNPGGTVNIFIPVGAADKELKLTIEEVLNTQDLLKNAEILISSVYEILKNFLDNFKKPVTLTLSFDPTSLKDNQRPAIFYYDELSKQWVEVLGGEINDNKITAQVDHFTKFAVLLVNKETEGVGDVPSIVTISFSDTKGHWAEAKIKQAVSGRIVTGYPDGTFKPNNIVTRAQFAMMLMNAMQRQGEGAQLTFTDTEEIKAWAYQSVAQAVQDGIINGYDDGSFRPDAQITRSEMAVMVANVLGQSFEVDTVTGFADDKDIPEWAKSSVDYLKQAGIVHGNGDNRFAPQSHTTRAEAITVVLNMLAYRTQ